MHVHSDFTSFTAPVFMNVIATSAPHETPTDLAHVHRFLEVRVVLQREQHRRVVLHDREQRRQAVRDRLPLYASSPQPTPTQRVVQQLPRHRHLDRVLVEAIQHLEQHVRLRRLQLQLRRLRQQPRLQRVPVVLRHVLPPVEVQLQVVAELPQTLVVYTSIARRVPTLIRRIVEVLVPVVQKVQVQLRQTVAVLNYPHTASAHPLPDTSRFGSCHSACGSCHVLLIPSHRVTCVVGAGSG